MRQATFRSLFTLSSVSFLFIGYQGYSNIISFGKSGVLKSGEFGVGLHYSSLEISRYFNLSNDASSKSTTNLSHAGLEVSAFFKMPQNPLVSHFATTYTHYGSYSEPNSYECSSAICTEQGVLRYSAFTFSLQRKIWENRKISFNMLGGTSIVSANGRITEKSWSSNAPTYMLAAKLNFKKSANSFAYSSLSFTPVKIRTSAGDVTMNQYSVATGVYL